MRDYTACAVFLTPDASGYAARCYDHEPVWSGAVRPATDPGLNKAIADAEKHDRSEHPNV